MYSRFFVFPILYLRVRVSAMESRITVAEKSLEASTDVRRLLGPCAFTCIQGAPLVVIKLSCMTDLPGFRPVCNAGVHRPCERPALANMLSVSARSLENWIAFASRMCARDRLPLWNLQFRELFVKVIYVFMDITIYRSISGTRFSLLLFCWIQCYEIMPSIASTFACDD